LDNNKRGSFDLENQTGLIWKNQLLVLFIICLKLF
jgi:hypothetical protein